MVIKQSSIPVNKQKTYRTKQSHKGLVRFELQVRQETKFRFDAMVAAKAEELEEPWDERRRLALARATLFDQLTESAAPTFDLLNARIKELEQEVAALAPNFFGLQEPSSPTPLPQAIQSLPDDPAQLKALLAKTYKEAQTAKLAAQKHQFHANQFEALYNAASSYNQELKQRLELMEEG